MKVFVRKTISITASILCSFFVCISLHAIHVKYIKGTFGSLEDEFKHCSPTHGAGGWETGLLHKYHDFGDKKDATIQLIINMFHVVQGSFSVTTNNSYPAKHFSARLLGKIIGEIERWKREKVNLNERVDLLITLIKYNEDFQVSIGNARTIYEELLENQKNLGLEEKRDAILKKSDLNKRLADASRYFGREEFLAKSHEQLRDALLEKSKQPANVWQKELHKTIRKGLLRTPIKRVGRFLTKHKITGKMLGTLMQDHDALIKKFDELSAVASEKEQEQIQHLFAALKRARDEQYIKSEVAKGIKMRVERINTIVSVLDKALLPEYLFFFLHFSPLALSLFPKQETQYSFLWLSLIKTKRLNTSLHCLHTIFLKYPAPV